MKAEGWIVDLGDTKLMRKVGPVLGLKILTLLLTYLIFRLITQQYGSQGSGIFAMYVSVVWVGGVLLSYGFGNVALKLTASLYRDERGVLKQDYMTMVGLCAITGLTVLPLVWVGSGVLSEWLMRDFPQPVVFKLGAVGMVAFGLLQISSEVVRGTGRSFAYMIFKDAGAGVIMIVLTVYFIMHEYGMMGPVWAHFAGLGLSCGGCFIMVLSLLRRAQPSARGHGLKYLFGISMPMLVSKGLNSLAPYITVLVSSRFVSIEAVGIYLVADRLSNLIPIFAYSLNVTVAPGIAYHFRWRHWDRLKQLTQASVRLAFWMSLPIVLILISGSHFFLGFFGQSFLEGGATLFVLILSDWVDTACGPVGYLLIMTGKESTFGKIMLVCTVSLVIFLLVLTPLFGILGSAIANLLYVLSWNLASIYHIRKHLNFNPAYLPWRR